MISRISLATYMISNDNISNLLRDVNHDTVNCYLLNNKEKKQYGSNGRSGRMNSNKGLTKFLEQLISSFRQFGLSGYLKVRHFKRLSIGTPEWLNG